MARFCVLRRSVLLPQAAKVAMRCGENWNRALSASGKGGDALRRELESRIGADVDSLALDKCARRLSAIAAQGGVSEVRWNLHCGDMLAADAVRQWCGRFDFVAGNPPYVRIQNLGESRRRALQRDWKLCAAGSTDIYIAFMELGMRLLKNNGGIRPNSECAHMAVAAFPIP